MPGKALRIELLGRLSAERDNQIITRFRTHKTGLLLAYLAFYPKRIHAREELIEMLWSESDTEAGRASLRTALASLRRQLEPAGSVFIADRANIQINPNALTTDVAEFESALKTAEQTANLSEKITYLEQAVELYGGEFLPGFYENWVVTERERLAQSFLNALGRLAIACEQAGELERAIEHARRAVNVDSLREESHCELIRLYAKGGQILAARRQYHELERILREELNVEPAPETRSLVARLETIADDSNAARDKNQTASSAAISIKPSISSIALTARLPVFLTKFVDRKAELEQIERILSARETRILTLTGMGGSGKTRLAVEAARNLLDEFDNSIYFVSFADLRDARLVSDTLLKALNLSRLANSDPLAQAAAKLSEKPSLLILDNFEHLLAEGSLVVREFLERAPSLVCLITSRQPLDISGERELPVLPLPIPPTTETTENLLEFGSVRLFVDRAQAARPDFQITQTNAEAMAQLCRKLEGIPLAIELAAAQAKVLTPSQMLGQLERRFDFLVSRRRDAVERHRTLRAAIDWSYQQLAPELQRFFAGLSVFRGGWEPWAAEALCEEPCALDFLAKLQESSLVVVEEHPKAMRFRMLETVREYAAGQLEVAERARFSRRHADFFLQLAETLEPELVKTEQSNLLKQLEIEHDNIRAALGWYKIDENCTENGLRLASSLLRYWTGNGHPNEGREYLEYFLASEGEDVSKSARAKAFHAAGLLSVEQGDYAAATVYFTESLALRRELEDKSGVATLLTNLGMTVLRQGNYEQARNLIEESLHVFRELGDKPGTAVALGSLGRAAQETGDYAAARAFYEESLAIKRESGDKIGIATSLANLGETARYQGDYLQAKMLFEESLTLCRNQDDKRLLPGLLHSLGEIAREQGDDGRATAFYVESLRICREKGEKRNLPFCLEGLAAVVATRKQPARAARLFGAAAKLRETMNFPLPPVLQSDYESTIADVRGALDDETFTAESRAGQTIPLEQMISYSLEALDANGE
ncbi:MAG TPA: tetratricopeptide repeat protein [Pyrinomonadaceae bacterium]|nr:tetratricopeptide repeat protein [Pyrinomonadaceae bacterium]